MKRKGWEIVTSLRYAENRGVCHAATLCVTILKSSSENTVKTFIKNFSRKYQLLSANNEKDLH